MNLRTNGRKLLIVPVLASALLAGGAVRRAHDACGPFTDVSPALCHYVLEMYYLGITAGTSPTTYSPDAPMTRGQAAVFVSKGVNQAIARSSRRAALGRWWPTYTSAATGTTNVGAQPLGVRCDGADVWTANNGDGTVSRVRASDGRLLETWAGAHHAFAVLVAMGRVFVTGAENPPTPGKLYVIDPAQPPAPLTSVADLGLIPVGIAFDGSRIWTANAGGSSPDASVSIVEPGTWSVTNVSGFENPYGILWDGSSMWLTQGQELSRLDANGAVVEHLPLNGQGYQPVFDGVNIWVPTISAGVFGKVVVLRAATGEIVKVLPPPDTLDSGMREAAFDGRRVVVTDYLEYRVALYDAATLEPIPTFNIPSGSFGACSDGVNFFLALRDTGQLARF